MKHMLVSRDCTVKIDKDGLITISSSLIKGGSTATYKKEAARSCLRSIMSFGDELPNGVWKEIDNA